MGDKLAASVRESKQQQTAEAAKPATQAAKADRPETTIKTMPACHVWPD